MKEKLTIEHGNVFYTTIFYADFLQSMFEALHYTGCDAVRQIPDSKLMLRCIPAELRSRCFRTEEEIVLLWLLYRVWRNIQKFGVSKILKCF